MEVEFDEILKCGEDGKLRNRNYEKILKFYTRLGLL